MPAAVRPTPSGERTATQPNRVFPSPRSDSGLGVVEARVPSGAAPTATTSPPHSFQPTPLMQILVAALIAVLVFLQYLLWLAEDGVRQTYALRIAIQAQTDENESLDERNRALEAEVQDLKNGLMAIEERARSEMGMIRRDETFYRILEQPLPPPSEKPALPGKPGAPHQKPTTTTAKPLPQLAKPPATTTAKPSVEIPKPRLQPAKPPAATAKPPAAATTKSAAPTTSPTSTAKPNPPFKPSGQ